MPFQALPIALRANTGDPISKLLWIEIVQHAQLDDAPNGKAWADLDLAESARFAQCTTEEVLAGWALLERQGLILIAMRGDDPQAPRGSWFLDVELPVSTLHPEDRRRIKASPDQVGAVVSDAKFTCAGCGQKNHSYENWHVDHIIPRAVGGADVEANLQPLCGTCNSKKGAKTHWVDFLGGRR